MIDVLRAHAEHRPNQVAYRFLGDGEHVTATMKYAELDVLAKSVARTLRELGDAQQRVILAHTPGLDFIVDLMGCLYAGMVAVPVYPPTGHREIATADAVIRASRPVAVLSDQPVIASALGDAARVPGLSPPARGAAVATEWAQPTLECESLALLQFTSGSTGTPRGVRVQHRNLLANQARMRAEYHQNADSVVVSWLPFYHDMGLIGSVLHSLYLGATCVLMSPLAFLQEPIRWLRAISEFGGTISPAPDFAYALCARRISRDQAAALDLRSWQVAVNGGEPVHAQTVRSFSERFAPAGFDPRAMVASYGLAEATLLVAADDPRRECHVLHSADGRELVSCGLVPEGITVVDAQGHPVAPGEVGEICVTGESVADGYWEQPDLSAETFDLPIGGARYLRTGDLGFVSDGELWISGRAKDVLVVRGRNHYPQDIEATVEAAAPAIRPGCVAAFLDGDHLIVVAETRDDTADPDIIRAVRAAVSRRHGLSAEVVFVRRNTIPKTSSGKIRRRACREAFETGQLKQLSSSRASEVEVLEALTAVLGANMRTIPPERSIAELGVDSLQAVALQHELQRRLRINVTIEELLDHTTVADLAAATRQWPRPPPRAAAPSLLPATVGQQALWLLHQLDPSGHRYLIRRALRVKGNLDVAALGLAVRDVAGRHPALRARVVVNDGHVGFDCCGPVPSLTVRDADDCFECAAALAAEQIDLTTGPPARFTLIRSGSEDPVLLVVVHHIVADLWSLSVLLTELLDRYSWHRENPDAITTDVTPAPTMAHIVQCEREVLDGLAGAELRDQWTKLLADAGTTRSPLPVDRADPPRTWAADQVVVRFAPSLADEVRRTAVAFSVTPFAVLLSAYCLLLCRSGNTTDVVVGVPTAVRPDPRSAEVIGYCVNTLPVPVRVPLSGRVDQFIGQVARTLRDVLALRAYPLALIAETCGTNPDNRASLFSTMFGMSGAPNGRLPGFSALAADDPTGCLDTGDLKLVAVPLPNAVAQAELDVNVADVDDGFQLTMSYATESFDRATVEALGKRFLRVVAAMVQRPAAQLAEVTVIDVAQRAALVALMTSDGPQPAPDDTLIDLFDRAVDANPDYPAIASAGGELSYTEVNRRADRLASALPPATAGANALVGLHLPAGPDFVIAMLGAWRAGYGIVPLLPDLPAKRLEFIARDAQVRHLIIAGAECTFTSPPGVAAIRVDAANAANSGGPQGSRPTDVAYVVYTSGTTGQPKGVPITHANVLPLLLWQRDRFALGPSQRLAQSLALSFDFGLQELLVTLLFGGTLVFPEPEQRLSAPAYARFVAASRITALYLTPTFAGELVRAGVPMPTVSSVLLGGEVLWREIVKGLRALIAKDATIINGYGPTEASINCSMKFLTADQPLTGDGVAPVGPPSGRSRVYLCDPLGDVVPPGVPGEVVIGGPGVSPGYVNLPELSGIRFELDPLASGDARRFRTGDLGVLRPDGDLVVLGRLDQQIKIRGYRTEPDELRSVLLSHPDVTDATVQVRGLRGRPALAAAVVVKRNATSVHELRDYIAEYLPSHLLPTTLIVVDALPRNGHGKLDDDALAVLLTAPHSAGGPTALSSVEAAVARVWEEQLGVSAVSRSDNFFDLGGTSLLVAPVMARVEQELHLDGLPLTLLFDCPTLADLARRLDGAPDTSKQPAVALRRRRRPPQRIRITFDH